MNPGSSHAGGDGRAVQVSRCRRAGRVRRARATGFVSGRRSGTSGPGAARGTRPGRSGSGPRRVLPPIQPGSAEIARRTDGGVVGDARSLVRTSVRPGPAIQRPSTRRRPGRRSRTSGMSGDVPAPPRPSRRARSRSTPVRDCSGVRHRPPTGRPSATRPRVPDVTALGGARSARRSRPDAVGPLADATTARAAATEGAASDRRCPPRGWSRSLEAADRHALRVRPRGKCRGRGRTTIKQPPWP